jgi:capsular exopolysaccharide synthesis family protein
MSRIYEALQKAESERKSERREPELGIPDPPASAAMTTALADAEDAVFAIPRFAEAPMVGEPYVESSPRRVSGDSLDLSRIPARPWALSLPQLPALLERGPAVEQFRSLRSRIFELRDISPLKTILVSSGVPQEGKSFISTNLALSLARHKNSKVLLIDGDMRRYSLHQILGCESHPGLADYLAGKADVLDVLQRPEALQGPTAGANPILPNLTFIAGGNGGDKAADLSGSPRFGELIRQAAPHFDWIIVDSSPVLPVSDAVNLARWCDGVLLVARGGVTKFPVAQRAQSELKASKILGFVLNAVQETPEIGGYYGYDGYDATAK